MQPTDMIGTTAATAPYDALRAMRCRFEFEGRTCSGRGGDINWNVPGTHGFRCQKCRSFNVVHVVAVADAR